MLIVSLKPQIKSKSRSKSRSLVRIPTQKGLLRKYNYSIHNSQKARHTSLRAASRAYGALSVFRKLNVLVTYNKNTNPELSAKFKRDRNWVRNHLLNN